MSAGLRVEDGHLAPHTASRCHFALLPPPALSPCPSPIGPSPCPFPIYPAYINGMAVERQGTHKDNLCEYYTNQVAAKRETRIRKLFLEGVQILPLLRHKN